MERSGSRLKILAFVVAFMFVSLSTRLWFLQVLAGPQHERDARDNSLRTVATDALRGDILDSEGTRLVHNRFSLEVRINRDELGDEREATLAHLSEILDIPAQELGEALDTKLYYSYQPVPVAEFVPEEVYFKIREEPEKFKGVEVVEQSVRSYPQGLLGAHLVGWVGQIKPRRSTTPGSRTTALRTWWQGRHRSHVRTMAPRERRGRSGSSSTQTGRCSVSSIRSLPSPVTMCGSLSTSTSNGSPRKSSRQGSSAPEPSSTRAPEPTSPRTPAPWS